MERALSEVGITRTDSDITVLAQKHLEAMEVRLFRGCFNMTLSIFINCDRNLNLLLENYNKFSATLYI